MNFYVRANSTIDIVGVNDDHNGHGPAASCRLSAKVEDGLIKVSTLGARGGFLIDAVSVPKETFDEWATLVLKRAQRG